MSPIEYLSYEGNKIFDALNAQDQSVLRVEFDRIRRVSGSAKVSWLSFTHAEHSAHYEVRETYPYVFRRADNKPIHVSQDRAYPKTRIKVGGKWMSVRIHIYIRFLSDGAGFNFAHCVHHKDNNTANFHPSNLSSVPLTINSLCRKEVGCSHNVIVCQGAVYRKIRCRAIVGDDNYTDEIKNFFKSLNVNAKIEPKSRRISARLSPTDYTFDEALQLHKTLREGIFHILTQRYKDSVIYHHPTEENTPEEVALWEAKRQKLRKTSLDVSQPLTSVSP